jgi:uncharacterized protein
MPPLCIYHRCCADGFTAAWVVWKFYGEGQVEFHAATHGESPPTVDGREVYVVDFAYPRAAMKAMARHARRLTLIDHHRTAAQELEGLIRHDGVVDGVFDMAKSGCLLTWEWFFKDTHPPPALLAVSDRDLWKFEWPWTREIFSALTSYPYEFAIWDTLMEADRLDALRQEGIALERKQQKDIAETLAAGRHLITIVGHTVPACNVPSVWVRCRQHPGPGPPLRCLFLDRRRADRRFPPFGSGRARRVRDRHALWWRRPSTRGRL